jgi:hypothetical protein
MIGIYNTYIFVHIFFSLHLVLLGVQSAGWLDIQFTVGTSYERAEPLAEKNAAVG